jgi:hypothetical protein
MLLRTYHWFGALWVVAVFVAAAAAAQRAAIQGTVTDDVGEPIAGVRVVVVHQATGSQPPNSSPTT